MDKEKHISKKRRGGETGGAGLDLGWSEINNLGDIPRLINHDK
jgi:hypothetical protein